MDLVQPVQEIKEQINAAFHKRLSRLGFRKEQMSPSQNDDPAFQKAESAIEALQKEGMNYKEARQKYMDEITFTLFNRLAGIKVIESHQLIPEILTVRAKHGDRSFAHNVWLEDNPEQKDSRLEGLDQFIRDKFNELSRNINLYNPDYPFDMLPEIHDLRDIIAALNQKIDMDNWQKDDILGWMYEAYNKPDYKAFKESGDKIEYDKLALSSQMYTPRWVVEFLVNNSLGKYWLEINPSSSIRDRHDIANAPDEPVLSYKDVKDIKLIDPACGSGNFLLYSFDLLAEIYEEEGYRKDKIPGLILKKNLHGLDIDERAVQIARLQLYIKANLYYRNAEIQEINVVSSDFHLPEFDKIEEDYFPNIDKQPTKEEFTTELWNQLTKAHKFGSLIKLQDSM